MGPCLLQRDLKYWPLFRKCLQRAYKIVQGVRTKGPYQETVGFTSIQGSKHPNTRYLPKTIIPIPKIETLDAPQLGILDARVPLINFGTATSRQAMAPAAPDRRGQPELDRVPAANRMEEAWPLAVSRPRKLGMMVELLHDFLYQTITTKT